MIYTYLLVNIFTISFPLARSFEHRIAMAKKWHALLPAIAVTAAVFIAWDVWFTALGVWGFNPAYLTGITLINLPVEEWLFFITVPYACIFIYECCIYFIKKDILGRAAKPFSAGLASILLVLGFFHLDQMYTAVTFIATGLFLIFHLLFVKKNYLGRFYLGYFISLIPFFLVNGLLTGSWIPEQVVWYNNAENFGIRLGTIPVEDPVY